MTARTTNTWFITDLGRSVDASDDLAALMARYEVPAERVVQISSGRKPQEKEG